MKSPSLETVSSHCNLGARFELKTYATPASMPALQIRGEIALFRQMLGVTCSHAFRVTPKVTPKEVWLPVAVIGRR
jgi:hypothetical protein